MSSTARSLWPMVYMVAGAHSAMASTPGQACQSSTHMVASRASYVIAARSAIDRSNRVSKMARRQRDAGPPRTASRRPVVACWGHS